MQNKMNLKSYLVWAAMRVYNKNQILTYNNMNNKNHIYSIRLTSEQRAKLDRKAQDLNVKPSELLRSHIFNLLNYGSNGFKGSK
jgi:hypothetical protein